MTEYDIHEELYKLAKATVPSRTPFQECATPNCTGRAVGSLCQPCAEDADKALNEALDARECPHDHVTAYSEGGTKYAQCDDCLEGLPIDYSEMEVDTKEMNFDCE